MHALLKVVIILTAAIVLSGCGSRATTGKSHAPVGLHSGCGGTDAPIPFVRGGGDQFYYC